MSVLDVQGLRVSYETRSGRRDVVHGVDLAIGEGEVVALVGESGSGKSTTAHALIGLLPEGGRVEGGSISLGGVDISGWGPKRLRSIRGAQVGLIPQDPVSSLDPVRPIGVQVGEILRLHGVRDRAEVRGRVLELLERVGLDDPGLRARQYPHELSGGMRQRVLIATAIALRPRLIIADEPTSALDATVQRRILDLIDDLRREEGTAVLLVTHDLGVAADRAQRIVVLNQGRVVEQGSAAGILSSPSDPYTRQLLADAPALATGDFRRPAPPLFLRDAAAAAAENPFAIVAEGLVKEFTVQGRGQGPFRAVDDVSFQVRRGTTHALVGESGSGKTTTARLVTRFLDPDAGRIELDGVEVAGLKRDGLRQLRRRIQLVYQNPFSSLDPRQSIAQIVAEPLHNFAEGTRASRRARAAALLDRVALPADVLERSPRELSGGQRQRVAIARALAINPDIVVLDEAVSALDVTVQARILELLESLQQELGLTYLFISHDLAVVRRISHTVSVMRRGRIVETRSTEDLFLTPTHEYTRELLAAVPGRSEVAA
ncbi:peptide/nickel transport system ATP-binding protein [Microbacterium terrae]|uniref:Glutathione import ATP-binding protein GsiA n=1 Tax=Microbacterium terrae TaxID=69369 RepID=A0A0M2HLL5_9MICO|nr:ABC transporter ATP-binding protein [Microbacterium terrae]KJL45315.1 Glutathione import ATP-binding protein GsiA [Microbacterium terrae]MBP1078437.1 peptide/nickel transport system ATP-binding protein [Microbacterium terrae]GLJ99337.1 ABC transporter ATP-binding protein [Microbacterium terrae]